VTIRQTRTTAIKRAYPHVNEIADWKTSQTTRLLWDRIHSLEERLQSAEATITQLIAGHNTNETALASVTQDAQQALALSQQIGGGTTLGGGTGTGDGGTGGGGLPGGGDGGGGAEGCAAAGGTGHDSGGLLTAIRAGQIACGTANEFSALKNVTADLATRESNAEQLLRRMIWHLKQAGFSAGRQKNPSGAISKDKLTVVVDAVLRAYDMFQAYDDFTQPMGTHMNEVGGPQMIDDAGIPD